MLLTPDVEPGIRRRRSPSGAVKTTTSTCLRGCTSRPPVILTTAYAVRLNAAAVRRELGVVAAGASVFRGTLPTTGVTSAPKRRRKVHARLAPGLARARRMPDRP